MKKSIIISLSVISVVSIAMCVLLPLKVVAAILCLAVLGGAFFGILFALHYKAEQEMVELERRNPELARKVRIQMWEQQMMLDRQLQLF